MKNSHQCYALFPTAWGTAAVAWQGESITRLLLPEKSSDNVKKYFSGTDRHFIETAVTERIAAAITQMQNYFSGHGYDFRRIKLDLTGCPPFAQRVYQELQKVGPGSTISYKGLAIRCGNAAASRAVGGAVGSNPIPLLIPCHRVINADGRLGGFSAEGGLQLKARMLQLENINLTEDEPVKVAPPALLADIDIDKALSHLAGVDPELGRFIKIAPRINIEPDTMRSPFQALLETIVYQQLTGKAAATIYGRLMGLFSADNNILPLDIIRANDEELRSAGLSGAKIAAARDLAEFAISGQLPDLKTLRRMPDQEIINTLTRIKGIGRWTVEMLLIFRLGRADVAAADDYGLRKGLAIIRGTPESLPDPKEFAEQARIWKPFRSIASWYLWRASEAAKSQDISRRR